VQQRRRAGLVTLLLRLHLGLAVLASHCSCAAGSQRAQAMPKPEGFPAIAPALAATVPVCFCKRRASASTWGCTGAHHHVASPPAGCIAMAACTVFTRE
jgi:hypothetical protein